MKSQLQKKCQQISRKKNDIASVNTGITSVRQSYFGTPVKIRNYSRSTSKKKRGIILSKDLKKFDKLYSQEDLQSKNRPKINKNLNPKNNQYQESRKLFINYKQLHLQSERKIHTPLKKSFSLQQNNSIMKIKNNDIVSHNENEKFKASIVTVKDLQSVRPSRRITPAGFSKGQNQSICHIQNFNVSQYFIDSLNQYYRK